MNSKMSSIAVFTVICMCYVTIWGPKIHYLSVIQTVTNYNSCLNDSAVCDGYNRCLGQQVQLSFEMVLVFCTEVRCLHNLLSQPEVSHTADIQILLSLASFSSGAGGKPVFSWVMYWYKHLYYLILPIHLL